MCDMVSAVCLHVHTFVHTLLVHSAEAWGFSKEYRMNVAAETGYLPCCVEHRPSCWGRYGCCCWQNTQFFPDMSVLMNVFWAREKEAYCVLVPALACAPTVLGHPELHCSLGPGGYVESHVALYGSQHSQICMTWSVVGGKAHSRRGSETRNFYFTRFSH